MSSRRPELNRQGEPVVWWIGVSTKHQKYSPRVQFDWCWNISYQNGLYPIAILRVPGQSRNYIFYQDAAKEIVAYQILLDLLQSNNRIKPKYLLVHARDRLGRNALATQVEALCQEADCKIWSGRTGKPIDGNVGQIFASGMELTMARAETHQTQERRKGAVLKRVKEKKLPYAKPEYGYRTIRDERGKSIGVELDPFQAPIRQQIDEWFIAGNSPVSIARRLNARYEENPNENIPPGGNTWYPQTIRRLLKSRYPSGEYRAKISGEQINITGIHPVLRTPERQKAIDRQFTRRSVGTQRGNSGPARYYGIAHCADCEGKMILGHKFIEKTTNKDRDYICGTYRKNVRLGRKSCSTHYTYEGHITEAIVEFFQQPVDEVVKIAISSTPSDKTLEIEKAYARLNRIRQEKREAVRLRVKFKVADDEFEEVINELSRNEQDTLLEISELETIQAKIPDADAISNWVESMLSVENLRDWLSNDDPHIIRSVLAGRIKVLCYQRPYRSLEPAPRVEFVI